MDSYWQAGDLDVALSECELVIQITPDLAMADHYRGQIYEEIGQLENAISDYQEAIRLDPGLEDVWDNLKRVERDIEEEYQRSSTKQHLNQALAYAYNDEPERALEECKLARQTMPGIAIAYNYLGMIYEELTQLESAIDAYLESIRLNPRFYAARENLSNARLKQEEEQYRQVALENWEGMQEEHDSWFSGENEIITDSDESQDLEIPEKNNSVPGWLYMDEKDFLLIGWPGHRTRPGRTGYDPLETDFEAAHMVGIIIRLLFTRKFRTQNPIDLLVMTCVGFIACVPLLLGGMTLLQGEWDSIMVILIYSPYWVVGVALLMNVFLSLRGIKLDEYDKNDTTFF